MRIMSRRKWTEKDIKQMMELGNEGYTNKEIGQKFGVSRDTIQRRLSENGYKRPPEPYLYETSEVVNDTLKIIKQIRIKTNRTLKSGEIITVKGYLVQSLVYPTTKPYEIREGDLKNGCGCAYVAGMKVCEENSLYTVKNIHKYLNMTDEEMKKTHKGSAKKITAVCTCGKEKIISIDKLVSQGIACSICSTNTSYPELFFESYCIAKNISYRRQVKYNDTNLRFDFYIEIEGKFYHVETHGLQHYEKGNKFYDCDRTIKSDISKREYCKENNHILIEIDCRESTFSFIQQQINSTSVLPNIEDEDIEIILNTIEYNKSYDVKNIIKMYKEGKTTVDIAKINEMDVNAINRLLRRNNIELRNTSIYKSRSVRCVTTGVTYPSARDASRHTKIDQSSICKVCKGKQKSAGGFHWEYVEEE